MGHFGRHFGDGAFAESPVERERLGGVRKIDGDVVVDDVRTDASKRCT
jgi:hypothetical protein